MVVRFIDNHILIAEKPAGMPTQPDFVLQMKAWIKEEYDKPGNVFLEPIHRLDKPVSGLVLFARTSKALSRLQALMRAQKIEKTYVARLEGHLITEGELVHHILHGDHKALIDPKGKEARLTYKILAHEGNTTLVEVKLITGRYHQIRAQFAAIGHPILGDAKYGSQTKKSSIALKATKLIFEHPVKKEIVSVLL